jgi:two-component system cell cycle sensor histidine kinase/response regulator CckA
MDTVLKHAAARRSEARTNAPTLEGERQASRFRLAMGPVGVLVVAVSILSGYYDGSAVLGLIATVIGWAAISALTLHVIYFNRYRPWLSYVSAGADVAFCCILPFSLMAAKNHNFTCGTIAAVFYLVITLAAVRRGPALVVLVAISSAVAYLLITGFLFAGTIPGGSRYLVYEHGVLTGINFTDQMARALGMVVVGWLVAYVARSLRNSERHYQELFEAIPDGIVITRANGTISTVNRRFAAMVGAAAPSLVDTKLADLLRSGSGEGVGVRSPTAIVGPPHTLKHADGSGTSVRIASSPIDLTEGEGAVMSVRDVTDHTHLERELARAQKLETIGRLAGGLAHDFNNILGGILGAASVASYIADRLPPPVRERFEKQLEVIENGGRNARDVVKKLLDFTRTSPAESRRLSLLHVLSDVVTLCRKTFSDAIEMTVESTTANDPSVLGDESALKQALLSVCLNAGDSMPKGGRIALRVEDAPRTRSFYARHPEATPGVPYLCAAVEDNGPGIDPGTLDEIFDPGFSGRAPAGIPEAGLPTVYKLARQHDGFIEVTSSAKVGTCFRLYLPRADAVPAEPAAEEMAS